MPEASSAVSSLKGDFIRSNMNRNGSFVVLHIPGMPGLFLSRMGSLWGFGFFFFFPNICHKPAAEMVKNI